MAEPGFLDMRAGLVARGLIGGEAEGFPLTVAGLAHTDAVMAELAQAEAPAEPAGPGIVWRIDLAATACKAGSAPKTRRRSNA